MDKTTEEEAQLSLELTKKMAHILEGHHSVIVGAALGQAFAGWLMNHPEGARYGLAMSFLHYTLRVCETMQQMDAAQPKH